MAQIESARLDMLLHRLHISRTGWLALIYLLLIALAELLVAVYQPVPGLCLHALILLALLIQASPVTAQAQEAPSARRRRRSPRLHAGALEDRHIFYLMLALVPLIRLMSLVIPFRLFPLIDRYMVVGLPLFAAAGLAAFYARLAPRQTGLTLSMLPLQLLVALSGLALGYVEYRILRPAPLVEALSWPDLWQPALILLIFTGFLEEWLFRGLLQTAALAVLGRFAIPYVSLVFTVVHFGYRSLPDLVFVFAVAMFFGYFAKRSGSILGVTLAHGLINIFLYLIFPLL